MKARSKSTMNVSHFLIVLRKVINVGGQFTSLFDFVNKVSVLEVRLRASTVCSVLQFSSYITCLHGLPEELLPSFATCVDHISVLLQNNVCFYCNLAVDGQTLYSDRMN